MQIHFKLNNIGVILNIMIISHADSFQAKQWIKACKKVEKSKRKGFNSAVIQGAWALWNNRNSFFFFGATPSLPSAQHLFKDEFNVLKVSPRRPGVPSSPWEIVVPCRLGVQAT